MRSRDPSGSAPATSTSTATEPSAPAAARVAASSIARRLSSIAVRRAGPSGIVKKPERQWVDTRSPESATIDAATSSPTSCTGSRHSPIAGTPASVVARSASAREACLIVP